VDVAFSILSIYAWVLVGCVVCLTLCIARFYQIKYAELYDDASHKRTYYRLLYFPLVLFIVAAVRYAILADFVGDVWGDIAFFVGGIVLAALGLRLQHLMAGGRR